MSTEPESSPFEIKHRWSGRVLFTATLEVAASVSSRVRLGLAIRQAYLSGADLSRADLSGANLSEANLSEADLSDANLSEANLSEADLSDANLSDADLSDANLSGADLSGANLSNADLSDANLSGADLSGANLSRADLSGADLSGANLSDADLSGADLSGAYLSGAPVIPDIHKAVYAAASLPGALDMSTWHRCETTHCRAGWVVTLAGKAGAALEGLIGTSAAAAAIYLASDPERFKSERLPNFYAPNEAARADMKRLAEEE